jgi:O-antigen ligase
MMPELILGFGLGLSKFVPLFVYCAGIAALLVTVFHRTDVGLYFLVPYIPLLNLAEKVQQYPLGKDFVDLFVVAIIIGTLLRNDGKTRHSLSLNVSIVMLLVVTYLGLWVGSFKLGLPYPVSMEAERLVIWKNYAIMPILYFVTIYTVRTRNQIIIILALMSVTMLMMDRHFHSTYKWVKSWNYSHDQRVSGPFTYLGPNELAGFFAQYTAVLGAIFLIYKKWFVRLGLAVVIAANTYTIMYLFSRGAYLAVAVVLTFYGIVADRRILIALLILGLSWQFLLPEAIVDRVEMTQTEGEITDSSALGRIEMWKQAIKIIVANPIVGVGFGSTPYLGFRSYTGEKHRNDIHSGYLETLMETGLVGFFCIFSVFYAGVRRGWRLFRASPDPLYRGLGLGFIGCVIAALVSNITGDRFTYLAVMGYFWIMLGMISVLAVQMEDEEAEALAAERAA